MSLDSFLAQFTGIQVQMHWMVLAASNPNVCCFELANRDRLGRLFTPWRINSDGSYADGNDSDANPLQINTEKFPTPIENEILTEVDDDVRNLTVPCYCLGENGLLILDGNHRLVSLYRSKQEFKLSIWAIKGPISAEILADLALWQEQ